MKIKTVIFIVISMVLPMWTMAQNDHYGESFELNSTLNANQNHSYYASDYIDLNTGFHSNPQNNNRSQFEIYPYYNSPNNFGINPSMPPDHDIIGNLGFYPLNFNVNESGAATISIPLEFPEGINGMTPHLSLEYNSQAGNGIMGPGWSIGGMSKISRVPYTYYYNDESHSVQFSGTDQLSLDGVILKKGSSNYYYPEIYDYSVVHSISNGYEVLKKDGLVYTYTAGYYLQEAISDPIEWHLSKVEDTYGNYIEYEYKNDSVDGAFYPTKIKYTGRTGLTPAYEIRFIYDAYDSRPDCPKKWFSQPSNMSCNAGFSRITKKLSNIECWFGEKRIIRYNLTYTTLDWNTRALAYVEKQFHNYPGGTRDYNQIIPLKFVWSKTCHTLQYEQAGSAVDLGTAYDYANQWHQQTAFAARFENEKMSGLQKYEHDIVHFMYKDETPHYHLNVFRSNNIIEESFLSYLYYQYNCSKVNRNFKDGRIIHTLMPADTDGDGLDEIVCVYTSSNHLKISLIKHNGRGDFEEVPLPNLLFSNPDLFNPNSFQIGDFNGDGLSDLVCLYDCHLYVRMSTASGAFSVAVSDNSCTITGTKKIIVADFSGDMKDQILVLNETGNTQYGRLFSVSENNGGYNISSPKSIISDLTQNYFANSCNRLCCGDFNGDSKKDILLMCSGEWRFYFSQGNGMFTSAQLMTDSEIVNDNFVVTQDNASSLAFAIVSDFDHDGCDDVSITLQQDFDRPSGTQFLDDTYRGAFRRDFLIRPQNQGISVRKIRNLRTWTENGIVHEEDRCIDSVITNQELFTTKNVFLPILGNHKGTSPNEILYSRVDDLSAPGELYAFLHNTGNFYPDSLTRAVTQIVTSLGATTDIKYRPVSYQFVQNQNISGLEANGRSLTPVLPFNGFMNIVEHVTKEVKDDGAGETPGKKYRLTRYHYSWPYYHTRGRGFLGFGTIWTREQGQVPKHDIITVRNATLNQTYHVLLPETTTLYHFRTYNSNELQQHQRTQYTYSILDNSNFASELGQIPNGVFSPYLSSVLTARNDGSPLKYEKTVTVMDGYGNVTSFERRFRGNTTTTYPYWEKTVTTYDNSITPNRWIIGIPNSETVTQRLTGVASDQVLRHTSFQNDTIHGRHSTKVTEPNSGKQLTEAYSYDNFGNLDTVTSDIGNGSPRRETYTYSADGRFMTAHTNAKGYTTHYYYHEATGLLDSVIDPNGLTTKYYYDYLCNLIKTELPSGILEEQVMKWVGHPLQNTYHPDTPDFGAPIYFVWSKRSGEQERYTFYDQHRRKLREVSGTMDGKKIYVDYRYHDVTGLLDSVSAPYYPEENETPQFTVYQYDYLERNTNTTKPNGSFMTHSYNDWSETVRDFDGQKRTLDYNPAGLVNKVSDYGNLDVSPVEIDYVRYGDGLVKTSKVGGDNATTITYTYDANRNPAIVADPSLGQLTYEYNGFGEMTYSATPRDTVTYTYDALGRMVTRTGLDGYSHWQYDQGFKGAVSQTYYNPVAAPAVSEYFAYDHLGRLTQHRQQVGSGEEWAFEYGYDAFGRRNAITYPSGRKFKWHYDHNGFMDRVTDAASNSVVWRATATDRWGNTNEFAEGNINVEYDYNSKTGLVTEINARRNGQNLFGQAYFWTTTGNLSSRADMMLNFVESFTYDRFNRLTSASVSPLSKPSYYSDNFNYDPKGNVIQKDRVGVYAYEHETNPYAVTGMSPNPLVIDRLADQTVDYTPFDKISSISQDGKSLTVNYGIDRQRVIQSFTDGKNTRAKRYFTPLYEEVTENGVTKKLHYLTSATGLFAIFVSTSNGGGTMHYTLKDHQGSLAAVVRGNTVERLSYDPWGRRRNTSDFGYDNVTHTFDRGYTLHEHYDEFDLINMNGRLYDPILGRMLSPDVVIQDEQSSQAYNRYSYCFNNPLRFTDPSGYVTLNPFGYYGIETYSLGFIGSSRSKSSFNTEASEGMPIPLDDWFENEETGAIYYNANMHKGDEGTGDMKGSGWKWLGENDMFSEGFVNSDVSLVAKNGGFIGTDLDGNHCIKMMLSGDKAKVFMASVGYKQVNTQEIVYSNTYDQSISDGRHSFRFTFGISATYSEKVGYVPNSFDEINRVQLGKTLYGAMNHVTGAFPEVSRFSLFYGTSSILRKVGKLIQIGRGIHDYVDYYDCGRIQDAELNGEQGRLIKRFLLLSNP